VKQSAGMPVGLLIYTLVSENQGLKKSRSVSNLRKISEIKVQIKRPSVTEIFDNLQPFQLIIKWIFILSWFAIL